MRRRDFLIGSAIAAGGAGRVRGQNPYRTKLARIAVMAGNFDAVLKNPGHPDDPNRTLDVMDLPDLFASRWGVQYVEPAHRH